MSDFLFQIREYVVEQCKIEWSVKSINSRALIAFMRNRISKYNVIITDTDSKNIANQQHLNAYINSRRNICTFYSDMVGMLAGNSKALKEDCNDAKLQLITASLLGLATRILDDIIDDNRILELPHWMAIREINTLPKTFDHNYQLGVLTFFSQCLNCIENSYADSMKRNSTVRDLYSQVLEFICHAYSSLRNINHSDHQVNNRRLRSSLAPILATIAQFGESSKNHFEETKAKCDKYLNLFEIIDDLVDLNNDIYNGTYNSLLYNEELLLSKVEGNESGQLWIFSKVKLEAVIAATIELQTSDLSKQNKKLVLLWIHHWLSLPTVVAFFFFLFW